MVLISLQLSFHYMLKKKLEKVYLRLYFKRAVDGYGRNCISRTLCFKENQPEIPLMRQNMVTGYVIRSDDP